MKTPFHVSWTTRLMTIILLGLAVITFYDRSLRKPTTKVASHTQEAHLSQWLFVRNVSTILRAASTVENVTHRLTRFNLALSEIRKRVLMDAREGAMVG
jgi:hypothetical protein